MKEKWKDSPERKAFEAEILPHLEKAGVVRSFLIILLAALSGQHLEELHKALPDNSRLLPWDLGKLRRLWQAGRGHQREFNDWLAGLFREQSSGLCEYYVAQIAAKGRETEGAPPHPFIKISLLGQFTRKWGRLDKYCMGMIPVQRSVYCSLLGQNSSINIYLLLPEEGATRGKVLVDLRLHSCNLQTTIQMLKLAEQKGLACVKADGRGDFTLRVDGLEWELPVDRFQPCSIVGGHLEADAAFQDELTSRLRGKGIPAERIWINEK